MFYVYGMYINFAVLFIDFVFACENKNTKARVFSSILLCKKPSGLRIVVGNFSCIEPFLNLENLACTLCLKMF